MVVLYQPLHCHHKTPGQHQNADPERGLQYFQDNVTWDFEDRIGKEEPTAMLAGVGMRMARLDLHCERKVVLRAGQAKRLIHSCYFRIANVAS